MVAKWKFQEKLPKRKVIAEVNHQSKGKITIYDMPIINQP